MPEPVAARDGSLAVPASDLGVPEARVCVLLRWLDGRFVDERLTPRHLRQVARLQAALHEHALSWAPPPGFVRPRTDLLTSEAKAEGNAPALGADAERGTGLVRRLLSAGDAAVVAAALEVVGASTSELDARPASAGLIHGDLHQENYLFSGGRAQAIDFDDCGRGYFLYDLAVTLFSSRTARPTPSCARPCSARTGSCVRCPRTRRSTSRRSRCCGACSCSCGRWSRESTRPSARRGGTGRVRTSAR